VNQDYQLYNWNDTAPTAFCEDDRLIVEVRPAKPWAVGDAEYSYRSSLIASRQSFGYGNLQIRAIAAKGNGLWPAIWMLPFEAIYLNGPCPYTDQTEKCTWPVAGEIDLMETVNDATFVPFMQTVHLGVAGTPGYPMDPMNQVVLPNASPRWWSKPHTYTLYRDAERLEMFVDGVKTFNVSAAFLQGYLDDEKWGPRRAQSYKRHPMAPFDDSNPFNLVFNIAVGGTWPCELYQCKCCPGDRRWPLHNTGINTAPFPRMVIEAICFDPLGEPSTCPDLIAATPSTRSALMNMRVLYTGVAVSLIFVMTMAFALYRRSRMHFDDPGEGYTIQNEDYGSM
jgi:hypothetical protein